MKNKATSKEKKFTSYQIFIIAILAILQFSIILDFMVLSPLGAQLMKELTISTKQFGWVVSAYAFSAGASGLLAAGFADKFDRKKLLLFFYAGFIIGTLFCGMAPDYQSLLAARVVTGIFGGVIGSIGFAIITDLFPMEVRGQVMGFVQMAFASSQILGIPVGLYLANHLGWHSPFLMIVGISILIWIAVFIYMQPIDAHLRIRSDKNPFLHLVHTVSQPEYLKAFAATALLATGGFMLMPFGSAFSVHNLGLSLDDLPMIYMVTGVCAMIAGPVVGKISDKIGKYKMFCIGSAISSVMIFIYCHLGITPLWTVIPINVILFVGISSRMISSSALVSAVPLPQDRGAFMGINSSIQQISGGIASAVAGLIVFQPSENAPLEHYDLLSYVVIGSILVTVAMMYMIHLYVTQKVVTTQVPKPAL
ncbi:MFS transporter [Cytophagaceae bacterium DM2B3-1]|uniref:MFS transporter n=1 Tax=Xanthocytophaga flava TaxID=3048013 RepID=A0ABT7CV10_9BACT|nr:MFS transporter [Xanthocytophaga flavus]MDJ1471360.1 MFS transporter [Xanthocytophaga flavus]MDJ1496762.1 MFS transporter [Xanthocytophaga flavus]